MLTLFHHPFCPHSRFVRLALGEFGITARMAEERVWERRQEFLALNPDCTTPVLVEEGYPAIPGAGSSPNISMKREASRSANNACCRVSPDRASKCAGS
jgi:hypothetical protein